MRMSGIRPASSYLADEDFDADLVVNSDAFLWFWKCLALTRRGAVDQISPGKLRMQKTA
jgi:hypothetical protein